MPKPSQRSREPRRPVVLAVDDHEENRYLVRTVLDAAGMTVLEATDGAQALAAAREARPDVIVSDILMPTMDGYELVRRLREGPDAVPAPVIFYTATYHQPEAEALARRGGVAAVVYKDGEVAELVRAIEHALGPDRPTPAPIADAIAYSADHAQLVNDKLIAKTEQLASTNLRLTALLDFCHVLGSETDPERVLQAAAEGARQLAGATCAGGVLFDESGAVTLRVSAGAPLPVGALSWRAAAGGPDVLLDAHIGGRPLRATGPGAGPPAEDVVELLAAPIAIDEQHFGTLFVAGSLTGGPFPAETEALVASLARHVAGFYGRALLLADARRNSERLALLHAIDAVILAGGGIEQLGRSVLPSLRQLVGADVAALTRAHPERGEVEIVASDPQAVPGATAAAPGSRYVVPPGSTFAPALEGARIEVDDVEAMPGEEGPLAAIRAAGLRSLVQEPLKVDGSVVGHLTVAAGSPGAFGAHDRAIVADVAAQFAIAFQQAALHAAISDAQARYRDLVERLPAVVYVDSLDSGAARYVSPQVERILGFEAAAWLSGPEYRLRAVNPTDRERLEAELASFRADPRPMHVEYRLTTGDGREVWLRDEIVPVVEAASGEQLAQGIIFDITEAKRFEEKARQGQKLEAVGLLAGGVAHDFNNLLTAIGGYSGMLLRDFSPFDPRREDVAAIQDATARATRLTRQLLAFSRRQALEPVVLDLVEAVNAMAGLLRQLIGEDIELRIHADAAPVPVLVDAGQLEQVVVNLVVNARDALDGRGTIELQIGAWQRPPDEATGSGDASRDWARLSVRDDGAGMDAETQAHIFEPFFTTKPAGEGTGLGLATVHGIVGQFGGSIDLQSAPGAGSTFRILLPMVAAADEDPAGERADASSQPYVNGSGTILLVEDDDAVRTFAARALTAAGYRVIAAGSGGAALAAVSDGATLSAVVTDARMPGMSGVQLIASLRRERPGVPVLFISGHTDELSGLAAAERPLFKPFGPEELVAAVGSVIASAAAA